MEDDINIYITKIIDYIETNYDKCRVFQDYEYGKLYFKVPINKRFFKNRIVVDIFGRISIDYKIVPSDENLKKRIISFHRDNYTRERNTSNEIHRNKMVKKLKKVVERF